jgi:hypothetical protein
MEPSPGDLLSPGFAYLPFTTGRTPAKIKAVSQGDPTPFETIFHCSTNQ